MRLVDRVALVTGTGSGIGEATALGFAAAGATVVCTDRNGDTAEHTTSAIQERGGQAFPVTADVSVPAQCSD